MTPYSDATVKIGVLGIDLETVDKIYITFSQPGFQIDIEDPVKNENNLEICLSQEQTSKISQDYPIQVQMNYIKNGKRPDPSSIAVIEPKSQLMRRIVHAS